MIFEKIKSLLAEQFVVDAGSITMDTDFEHDLNADSLDIVELTMALEEEFDLPELNEEEIPKLKTVGDIVKYISVFAD